MFDKLRLDKILFFAVIALAICGLIIFGSAALGVLAVNEVKFYSIIKSQYIYALFGGSLALFLGIYISPKWYKKHAVTFFVLSVIATICVFIPGLSVYHGGAHRWIDLGPLSIQPSEFLKITFIAFVAKWMTTHKQRLDDIRYGFWGYVAPLTLVTLIMLAQPDFGTYLVIFCGSFVVYFLGGATYKHIGILVGLALVGFCLLIATRPYMLERVKTFVNTSHDKSGSSWQLNQSLIALGSGGVAGQGYGQSIQKFNFLPEPIGDSIFAVVGEEFGFVGTVFILLLIILIVMRGLYLSVSTHDDFMRLMGIGIVSNIFFQSFLNIGSMIRLLPLTGLPLPLVSHGGTSFVITLFELGLLLGISRYAKK